MSFYSDDLDEKRFRSMGGHPTTHLLVVGVPWMMPARESKHDMLVPPGKVVAFVLFLDAHLLLSRGIGFPFVDELLEFGLERFLPEQALVVGALGRVVADPPFHDAQIVPRGDFGEVVRGMPQDAEPAGVRAVFVRAAQAVCKLHVSRVALSIYCLSSTVRTWDHARILTHRSGAGAASAATGSAPRARPSPCAGGTCAPRASTGP